MTTRSRRTQPKLRHRHVARNRSCAIVMKRTNDSVATTHSKQRRKSSKDSNEFNQRAVLFARNRSCGVPGVPADSYSVSAVLWIPRIRIDACDSYRFIGFLTFIASQNVACLQGCVSRHSSNHSINLLINHAARQSLTRT